MHANRGSSIWEEKIDQKRLWVYTTRSEHLTWQSRYHRGICLLSPSESPLKHDSAAEPKPSTPQAKPEASALGASRRRWLGRVAGVMAGAKGVKEGISAVAGLSAGATAGASYVYGKIKTRPPVPVLDRSDFFLKDSTTIVFEQQSRFHVDIIVKRQFSQQAKKAGQHRYQVACLGEWEQYKMYHQRNGRILEEVALKSVVVADAVHDLSVLQHFEETTEKDGSTQRIETPLHLLEDDVLDVSLSSRETVPKTRRFYSLRLSQDIHKCAFIWDCHLADLKQSMNCVVTAENKELVDPDPTIPLPLKDYDKGITFFFTWKT